MSLSSSTAAFEQLSKHSKGQIQMVELFSGQKKIKAMVCNGHIKTPESRLRRVVDAIRFKTKIQLRTP